MVGALAADPTAAGPAGPQLLDSLRGLQSTDDAVRQRAAFGLGAVLLDGTGLDPAYATAARVALARSLVGPGAPSAGPAGSATCLRITGGSPSPVVQEYARQVLDRVPAWQDGGFPADQAQRLRTLLGPVSAGSATLAVTSCP
jgi:hypothetical protein